MNDIQLILHNISILLQKKQQLEGLVQKVEELPVIIKPLPKTQKAANSKANN